MSAYQAWLSPSSLSRLLLAHPTLTQLVAARTLVIQTRLVSAEALVAAQAILISRPARVVLARTKITLRRDPVPMTPRLAALSANHRHMLAILAHDLTALAARDARLLGRELVRRALLVSSLSALAGDLFLPSGVHSSKAAALPSASLHASLLPALLTVAALIPILTHDETLPSYLSHRAHDPNQN